MKRNKGFTLMELVIVIAIIAVLLLILVPLMNGYIDNAQRTTCEANRKIVETDTKTALLFDREGHTFQQIFTEQVAGKNICPCGGKISYIGDANNFTIICSEHSTMQSIKNLGDPEVMQTLLDIMSSTSTSMDSTAIAVSDLCEAAKALKELEAAGVDLSSMNVETWQYDKAHNFFFWTEENIVSMSPGTKIPVMRYNGTTGTYTVWYGTVKDDGHTATATQSYNRFVVTGSIVPASGKDPEQTYETCYEIWKNTPIK